MMNWWKATDDKYKGFVFGLIFATIVNTVIWWANSDLSFKMGHLAGMMDCMGK